MTDNVKKFMETVSNDEALKAELTAAIEGLENAEQIPVVIEFAKKKGFELTKEDFVPDDTDINLDELETVTGGGGCGCAIGGGGSGDDLKCGCVFVGAGAIQDGPKTASQGCCVCVGAGAGATRRH